MPAFDQNIFTEWHARYHGRGVLIYWHVEEGSMAVHSQLITCSASEVAAMVEGAMRHGTEMDLEGNYVDSHGQSEIGFGITRLLGFKLLARIKRINHARLYLPGLEQRAQIRGLIRPHLGGSPALREGARHVRVRTAESAERGPSSQAVFVAVAEV